MENYIVTKTDIDGKILYLSGFEDDFCCGECNGGIYQFRSKNQAILSLRKCRKKYVVNKTDTIEVMKYSDFHIRFQKELEEKEKLLIGKGYKTHIEFSCGALKLYALGSRMEFGEVIKYWSNVSYKSIDWFNQLDCIVY